MAEGNGDAGDGGDAWGEIGERDVVARYGGGGVDDLSQERGKAGDHVCAGDGWDGSSGAGVREGEWGANVDAKKTVCDDGGRGWGVEKSQPGFFWISRVCRRWGAERLCLIMRRCWWRIFLVKDDTAEATYTLDGVFGMNFLVASAMVNEGSLVPDFGQLTPGAFRWIVINEPGGWLGLERNR